MTGARLPHDWFDRPLPPNVTIGEGSWLHSSFAFLHHAARPPHGVRIGAHSGVYRGSFFELGPEGDVRIGDYCALVGAIIRTNGEVVIEDYALIAHEVVIADEPFAAPGRDLAGPRPRIVIGRNAWIGARATLLAGAEIGEGAIVGAGAVVDFAVPPFAVAAGNPGRVVRGG